jgi:hypothetical protein
MDGRDLVAVADTGSDLNIMPFECAKREQFRIDTREEARTWVQFGDKSKTRTIGQVYVSDLSLDWRTTETPVYQQTLPNTKEAHDAERHSELFRRSQEKEEIALMPAGQQDQARAKEQRRERQWDTAHATCVHCLPV